VGVGIGRVCNEGVVGGNRLVEDVSVEIPTLVDNMRKSQAFQQLGGSSVAVIGVIQHMRVSFGFYKIKQGQNIAIGDFWRLEMIIVVHFIGK
jgi:hypothetical protein